ncbi:MAG: pyruvate, phosphate dikinase [Anaerolineae bacterium]
MTKYVYLFTDVGEAEKKMGSWDGVRSLLGGKGAGVADMTRADLPVPPGFTITTEACNAYYDSGKQFPDGMWDQVIESMKVIESLTGKKFGDPSNPLLVSVRSGAKFSMPGMMDTVLNLGLNPDTKQGLAKLTDNPRFAADAYRRFVQLFGKIVLGVSGDKFEHVLDEYKHQGGQMRQDTDLSTAELDEISAKFKDIIKADSGVTFPDDPYEQLRMAIGAVFGSWMGRRAIDYRRVNKIADNLGTAVNVQTMVFGNMGNDSATGVAFTRNPSTGENKLYGEYLVNAQGEDVVAGVRTPRHLDDLASEMPEAYLEFKTYAERLEKHYKDIQDLEFTIERGKLYMLQTRTGKRTGPAAVKIAVDHVHEGLISKQDAVLRVEPSALDQLLHPMIDPKAKVTVLTTGLPASPGAASGQVVFDPDEAVRWAKDGHKVVLVRTETAPEDFHGMEVSQAFLTARGGMTSHAAVVARGMGKPCVAGAGDIRVNYNTKQFTANGTTVKEGEWVTVDGSSGRVILGQAPLVDASLSGDFAEFMTWVDECRTMGVRANADIPRDAQVARSFGAEGIGLCRTEHMFFGGDRIDAVRQMILSGLDYKRLDREITAAQAAKDDVRIADLEKQIEEPRRLYLGALDTLAVMQQSDFAGLFREMNGFPVIIRTLDPPLHEFLPHAAAEQEDLAKKMGVSTEKVQQTVETLAEFNPMLGFRGTRLGIIYPEITEMQARAIFKAAAEVQKEGVDVIPEVMIPLVGDLNELADQAGRVRAIAESVQTESGEKLHYKVGTMIELPRAALLADEIAKEAEFFSYGTNDLTQTTFGLSRDDAGRFLPLYVERKILKDDPFQVLDQKGVGKLVELGVKLGRETRPDLEVGICGEHGGEPESVKFCYKVGLDYVSCSPYRVPIAKLAAAQAALGDKTRDK